MYMPVTTLMQNTCVLFILTDKRFFSIEFAYKEALGITYFEDLTRQFNRLGRSRRELTRRVHSLILFVIY